MRYLKLFKNIAVFVLILNLVGSSLLVPLVYLDFEVRRDFIRKTLCIEKDNPISTCNGNCFLKKQLKKTADEAQEKQSVKPIEITFFFHANNAIKLKDNLIFFNKKQPVFNSELNKFLLESDIFHPPTV